MQRAFNAPEFSQALSDYLWLLNRGYPEKRSRLLVADRYGLSRSQRTALLRGVFPPDISRRRRARRIDSVVGIPLLSVDGNNVLSTLCNYLYGRTLFVATDGFLRDDGENYSRGTDAATLDRAAALLVRHFASDAPRRIVIYLDISADPALAPADRVEAAVLRHLPPAHSVALTKSGQVDRQLIAQQEGALAGADSAVMDRSPLPLYDAALHILRESFSAAFPDLEALSKGTESPE